mmetsp:Transcript_16432/g.39011  ORF Transcript_16432/g.39011 Transcript_16432/m.39011 type:complete len:218 (-) Transcript_16432:365-1018(-)
MRTPPLESTKSEGCMMLPANLTGPFRRQVRPPSPETSRCTNHEGSPAASLSSAGPSSSLLGERMVPSERTTGLFFAGPVIPRGSASGELHVCPPSELRTDLPAQVNGSSPSLKKRMVSPLRGTCRRTGFQSAPLPTCETTSHGGPHPEPSCHLAIQMPVLLAPSQSPANQAASSSPGATSAMVEAWWLLASVPFGGTMRVSDTAAGSTLIRSAAASS